MGDTKTLNLDDVSEGDVLVADAGFDCIQPGEHAVLKDECGLYIPCSNGRHYLDGQSDERGVLAGLSRRASLGKNAPEPVEWRYLAYGKGNWKHAYNADAAAALLEHNKALKAKSRHVVEPLYSASALASHEAWIAELEGALRLYQTAVSECLSVGGLVIGADGAAASWWDALIAAQQSGGRLIGARALHTEGE